MDAPGRLGLIVWLYRPTNPLAPKHPRVGIVSSKHFLCDATWSGTYGDKVWVGGLQPNADTSEHEAT